MVIPADFLCISGFFLSVEDFFSCHSLLAIRVSVQYIQSIVDVVCAVSYTAAKYEWVFPLCYGFFPVCYGHRAVLLVIRGVTCRLPVYRRIFSCLLRIFSCHILLGICASVQLWGRNAAGDDDGSGHWSES